MANRFKAGWNWVRRRWLGLVVVVIAASLLAAYFSDVFRRVSWLQWTGFEHKTFWDVLELAVIPAAIAIVGYFLNRREREAEQRISDERAHETALLSYLDHMSELIIEKGLSEPDPKPEVKLMARMRTLTVFEQLDSDWRRKGVVFKFLYEGSLIDKGNTKVSLERANMNEIAIYLGTFLHVNLVEASMINARISFADLPEAELAGTNLTGAYLGTLDLRGASLRGARMPDAYLFNVDLRGADLRGAQFQGEDIKTRKKVKAAFADVKFTNAKYNHLTKWPDGFDPRAAGAILDESTATPKSANPS